MFWASICLEVDSNITNDTRILIELSTEYYTVHPLTSLDWYYTELFSEKALLAERIYQHWLFLVFPWMYLLWSTLLTTWHQKISAELTARSACKGNKNAVTFHEGVVFERWWRLTHNVRKRLTTGIAELLLWRHPEQKCVHLRQLTCQ